MSRAIKRITDTNWQQVEKLRPKQPGFLPRISRYGDDLAVKKYGLLPVEDMTEIIEWKDLKERLQDSRENKVQPVFHMHDTWAPKGYKWNQNGLPYCWTWSATGVMMSLRAMEQKETTMLAPVTLGWLVNWRSQGYYLDDTIRGLRERGVASAEVVGGNENSTNRKHSSYEDGWEEDALLHRLDEIWDIDTRNGDKNSILQAATVLCSGRPIYNAFNWWGHAVTYMGMRWDESKKNNVVWEVRNSHNEPDIIDMDGDRAVADEMYGFMSSVLTE